MLVSALVSGAVHAESYVLLANHQVVGALQTVQARYEETLTDIARIHRLGYEEIVRANPGVDVWLPGEGTEVRLPKKFVMPAAAQEGIVVNLAEYRLYHFVRNGEKRTVSTFPISIGRMDWATPLGRWAITAKQENPSWYPPESIRREHLEDGRGYLPPVVPPGPDNPLGRHALRLSLPSYLIHGTNRPVGVGMRVTHGCIRMYPEDIEWLFPRVTVKTPVTIVNQPHKFGWAGDDLYLEVHPPLDEASPEQSMTALTEQYVLATRDRPALVDWDLVQQAYERQDGIPVRIGEALAPAQQAGTGEAVIPQIAGVRLR